MTEKEFEALLSIEGYKLKTSQYEDKFWVATSTDMNTNKTKYSMSGSSKSDALALLYMAHYANN